MSLDACPQKSNTSKEGTNKQIDLSDWHPQLYLVKCDDYSGQCWLAGEAFSYLFEGTARFGLLASASRCTAFDLQRLA